MSFDPCKSCGEYKIDGDTFGRKCSACGSSNEIPPKPCDWCGNDSVGASLGNNFCWDHRDPAMRMFFAKVIANG